MRMQLFVLPFLALHLVPISYCSENIPLVNEDVCNEVVRIFIIKRLERAAELLTKLDKQGTFSKICSRISGSTCFIFDKETTLFSHNDITHCKEEIEKTKSLKPFLTLWASTQAHAQNTTVPYLKDIALLILEIYKAIYTACLPIAAEFDLINNKSNALMFGNLATLQAFELLNIIEKLTIQIPKLLDKYEITTGTLTPKEWIIKYWWLPPMAIAAIVLEGIFIYQVATGAKKVPASFR